MATLTGLRTLQQQASAAPAAAPPPAIQIGPVQQYMQQQAQQYQGYQQAAQQQAQQSVTAQMAATNPFFGAANEYQSLYNPQPLADTGEGGLFGDLLGAVTKPLDLLQYPLRGVVSTIKETGDLMHGEEGSWSDWWEQVQDPTFGYGSIAPQTGNKWLDRAIGFAGDIALDPMTYLTLGTSKFMGTAGRTALAGRAVEKNLGEEVIQRIGRLGEAGLSAAEREALELGPAGLRWGLPSANVRLPGTGRLATGGGRTLAAVRSPFTDTRFGEAMRRFGGARAPELRPYVERLATGKGPMTAKAAAGTYDALINKAGRQTEYLSRFSRDVRDLGAKLRGRDDIFHAVEAGVDTPDAKAIENITGQLFDTARNEYGVEGLVKRQKYMPHYNTKEWNDWLFETPEGKAFIDAPGMGSGRLEARSFQPGETYTLNGRTFSFDAGRPVTAADIEAKVHAAVPELNGVKLIETDPEQVLGRLLGDHASDVGEAQLYTKLKQYGIAAETGDVTSQQQIAWSQATRAERKAARKTAQKLNDQRKVAIAKKKAERTTLGVQGVEAVGKAVTAQDVLLERAQRLQSLAQGRVDATEVAQADAALRRKGMPGAQRAAIAHDEDQLATLVGEINRLDEAIPNLKARAAAEPGDPAYQMALRMAESRREELTKLVGTGRGASQKLFDLRLKMQRAQAALGEAPPSQVPPVPGAGGGLELATPETAGFGAQRQTVYDTEFERMANEMDTAQMRRDAMQGAMPAAGPEFEAAQAAAAQATERRQALLALGAPEENRRTALAAQRVARGEVEALEAPPEQFISELATLAEGTPIRPRGAIQAEIGEAGRDVTRRGRIVEALRTIRAPGKRITERGRRAVQRELTLNELANPNTLDESFLEVLPPEIRSALEEQATEFGEMLRPWTGSDKLHTLRPDSDIDVAFDPRTMGGAAPPPATARVQERLNAIDTERSELYRQAETSTREVTMPKQQAIETAKQNRQVRLDKLRATRDRLQAFRQTMAEKTTTPMRKETQGRMRTALTARERQVDEVIASTERQIAELEAKQQPRFEMWEIFEPESRDLFDDTRPRWETHLERLRTRRTNRARNAQRPGAPKSVTSRNEQRLAQLDQEIADTEELLAVLPPPPAQPAPRKVPVRVDKDSGTLIYQKRMAPEEVAAIRTRLRALNEEQQNLRRGAPGARQERPTGGVSELGAPMDSPQIREAAERVSRLNDFAVQYKVALDKGAPPGEATAARVARSVLENERGRVGGELSLRNLALDPESAATTEGRRAQGELFGRVFEPRARSVIEARQHRSMLKRLDAMVGQGRETEALESFQDIVFDPRHGVQSAATRQMQESEAAQLLGIAGKARPGMEIDTHAVIQNLDEAARARVMEEENIFGQLLMEMTGTRWQESTRGQKALWTGVAEHIDPRTGVGPRLAKRGRAVTPGQIATLIAGKSKAKRPEFLGQLFNKISPEARAQLLAIIERDAQALTRRMGDVSERVARLGGAEGAADQVAGNWFELLTGKGRLGEAPEAVDLSDFFGEGRYGGLAAERTLYDVAEREALGSLPTVRTPSMERIAPEAQAELDRLAAAETRGRVPAMERFQAAQQRIGGAPERVAALEAEMAPLRAAEQTGAQAGRELAAGEAPGALRAEAAELARPAQQELAEVEVSRGELAEHANLVRERIAARPQTIRDEFSALDQTDQILMGQGDEAVDDLVTIEAAVRNAQARVTRAQSVTMPKKVNTTNAYGKLVTDIQDATRVGADPETLQLLQSAAGIIPKMQRLDNEIGQLTKLVKDTASGKLEPIIRDVLRDNMVAFTSQPLGRELAMDPTVQRSLVNIDNLLKDPGALGKAFDTYTQFFKTYATMSPGFHVRNAMGAVFMNASDGVSIRNMVDGVRIWAAYRSNPNGAWWNSPSIPKRARGDVAKQVREAVYNTGAGGHFSASEVGAAASGQTAKRGKRWVFQNRPVRFSRRVGESVEGGVRAGMALDSLLGRGTKQAGSVQDATSRISRIHFNYSQVSEFDQKMRRIVPFWTFMSRNVPLQVQQMWLKPRTYLHYESFKRNMGEDQGEAFPGMPQYLQQLDAFRIGPDLALAPEFGPSQMEESIRDLGSMRMLSNLGPALKTPAQLLTGQNFFYGSPYKDNAYTPLRGELSPLEGIFGALGATEPIPGGGTAVETKWADAARDIVPTLGVLNRLMGTDPTREGRTTQALWNFLGFPGKQLTPEVLAAEQRRRKGSQYYGELDEEQRREALLELVGQ